MQDLLDPARHEALCDMPWSVSAAQQAVAHICQSAESAFDQAEGAWLLHPQDDPPRPGYRSYNMYWGAAGVVWALRYLQAQGAVFLTRDYIPWIERFPALVAAEAAEEMHGSASYLFGESGPLLLAFKATGRAAFADRLLAVVEGNLHNPANEPLWGNSGTVLAAIHAAEAGGDERWAGLVRHAVQALLDDMVVDPHTGTWSWQQDLYGKTSRYLGAGHGFAGNVYPALRAAALLDGDTVRAFEQRALDTLTVTAMRGAVGESGGVGGDAVDLVNWHVVTEPERIAAWRAKGGGPLVQDCHGAPGIICRLAGVPRTPAWDALLRGAGELTWHAGPLAKGPSLCHGTAGSALACLKLWRRFGETPWLERARRLAMHTAQQVEAARTQHGQGRHSLWTGDLGVACVLWSCIQADDHFPTLDVF
jgi:hypothetical protein